MAAKVSNAQLQQQLESLTTRLEDSMLRLSDTMVKSKSELSEKMDVVTNRMDNFERRIEKIERSILDSDNRVGEMQARIENSDMIVSQKITTLTNRVKELEEKVAKFEELPKVVKPLENLPLKVDQLIEKVEDRTNRQLRETLVFKNVPEEGRDESYAQTKQLLARVISTNCPEYTYEFALSQIKRAHRERNRSTDDHRNYRAGKRLIFAAFHSWDMCQNVIEIFRQKCIEDRSFTIAAEQKYGPLTSRRRQMAFQLRKQLKDSGDIVSGYVAFPAKLMVNAPGDVRQDGKKNYRANRDFSKEPVEFEHY